MDFSAQLGHKHAMCRTPLMLPLLLALAGCGEAVEDEQFAGDNMVAERVEPEPVRPGAVPVRVGELGPNFAACAGAGTTRNLDAAAGEGLAVRAAPFETVAETGAIPAGGRFFVCTRSHDQRWLGVVYDDAASLSPACGVSRPSPARRNYEGPCRSGWVSAALVKLIAG
jgi:hypothetical protein